MGTGWTVLQMVIKSSMNEKKAVMWKDMRIGKGQIPRQMKQNILENINYSYILY